MKNKLLRTGCVAMVVLALGGGLGAQMQPAPHPVFKGIKPGDRVEFIWNNNGGGWTIRGYNGTKNVEIVGPDYIVYRDVGKIHSVYISQINEVVVRNTSAR